MLVKRKSWLTILDNIKTVLVRLQNAAIDIDGCAVHLNDVLLEIPSWVGAEK